MFMCKIDLINSSNKKKMLQVDWEALTDEDEEDLGAGKGNVIQDAPSSCPTKESCRQCPQDSCWSSINCQKNKTSHFIKGLFVRFFLFEIF